MIKKYLILPIILIQLILVLISTTVANGIDDYEYLIVTTDTLKNCWDEFVEFNKRRCLRTKVKTIENIKASMTGTDDAEKLRNYIRQEYKDHTIVYVLLGGGTSYNQKPIPHREFFISLGPWYHLNRIWADMYFSCLDRWEHPGNDRYWLNDDCDDMGWEVYTARFVVNDINELNNMINKTIRYSEQPVANGIQNILLAGEYMMTYEGIELWGKDFMEQLIGSSSNCGYTTQGFPSDWSINRLYDINGSWTNQELLNTIQSGKVSWINNSGGDSSNIMCLMKLHSNQITDSNFTNNGTNANYFILYTQGQRTGNFIKYGYDYISTRFTSKIQNGAVAFIGPSTDFGTLSDWPHCPGTPDYALYKETHFQRFARYFHDAIFNKKIHYLEMMNAYSKEVNADLINDPDMQLYSDRLKWACYSLNLLGDPALSVWTETPKQWSELPNPEITAEAFKMETPPFTWVALLDNNSNIITTQLTSYDTAAWDTTFDPGDGHCKIEDDIYKNYVIEHAGEKLKVRIKAHNYLPYEDSVDIPVTVISNLNEKALSRISLKPYGKTVALSYKLNTISLVNISIYNSRGTLVKTIVNENQNAGKHTVTFRSDNVSNGIYYIKFSFNKNAIVKKTVLLK